MTAAVMIMQDLLEEQVGEAQVLFFVSACSTGRYLRASAIVVEALGATGVPEGTTVAFSWFNEHPLKQHHLRAEQTCKT